MSKNINVNNFASVKIELASPEKIREWSYGEVRKAETINYRSHKPEPDGLFCEKIFGPSKDFECYCGKYKKIRFRNIVCEKCGVEVTTKNVRRERMGHIELAAPVAHIWYVKGISPKLALILDVGQKQVEEIVYYISHIVLNPGKTMYLKKGEVLDDRTAREVFGKIIKDIISELKEDTYDFQEGNSFLEKLGNTNAPLDFIDTANFISRHTDAEFGSGAESIKRLLKELNVNKEFEKINEELKESNGDQNQRTKKLIKRLDVINSFKESGNKPEWLILDVLPVIPPNLRPLVQLDGGRFAASDLNDLYRRVISRNIRLKKLLDMNAPTVILNNEKRMLQEAVDALFDNSKRVKPVIGAGGRPLKSLSDSLKGKQGRFRQNLLGKRVDYSGRSVIAVGPELKMHQCGLPREMAVTLFKPFIIHEMLKEGTVDTHKKAEKLIDNFDKSVLGPLEKVAKNYPVLLNRAPTLHRLSIQAFEPVLIDGKAIRLHPIVCAAYNADFDGDQMAVHLPINEEAKAEAFNLMLASKNILSPRDGNPIVNPSQDMLLGMYYLSTEKNEEEFLAVAKDHREKDDINIAYDYEDFAKLNGKVFSTVDEVLKTFQSGKIHAHNRIFVRIKGLNKESFDKKDEDKYLLTSVGKILFNDRLPSKHVYLNGMKKDDLTKLNEKFIINPGSDFKKVLKEVEPGERFIKGDFPKLIDSIYHKFSIEETSKVIDHIKELGFKYAAKSGITISAHDIKVVPEKKEILIKADEDVAKINDMFDRGLIDEENRYNNVIKIWGDAKKKVSDAVSKQFRNEPTNPLTIILLSGARGSINNFAQISGMRGSMADAHGKTIEIPIRASFKEGLNISEFFISTHGARKGNTDKALKTADAGYLTRRLVDVAQDVIIMDEDCGCDQGVVISDLINEKEQTVVASLENRLKGRNPIRDVIDPKTNRVIVHANELITQALAKEIVEAGIKEVEIRTLFTCQSKRGICAKCYGLNLATGKHSTIGEAVGVIAAQSIGERGTQLTMQTFHSGGVAGIDITQGLPRIQELVEARNPKGQAIISEIKGRVESVEKKDNKYEIVISNEFDTKKYISEYNASVIVKVGQDVINGQQLTDGSINPKELLEVSDSRAVQNYILKEMKKVYKLQGDEIADKHIEVIIKQMLRKIVIVESGDTDFLPGQKVEVSQFSEANHEILLNNKKPAVGRPLLLGITKACLTNDSFLASASFQETNRMLTDAVIKGMEDHLVGLKENVILGKLIPAGTGLAIRQEEEQIKELVEEDFEIDD